MRNDKEIDPSEAQHSRHALSNVRGKKPATLEPRMICMEKAAMPFPPPASWRPPHAGQIGGGEKTGGAARPVGQRTGEKIFPEIRKSVMMTLMTPALRQKSVRRAERDPVQNQSPHRHFARAVFNPPVRSSALTSGCRHAFPPFPLTLPYTDRSVRRLVGWIAFPEARNLPPGLGGPARRLLCLLLPPVLCPDGDQPQV